MEDLINMPLGAQRLSIDDRISELEGLRNDINHKIKVLKNGFNAIGDGENILESNSILAQEVRKIMCEKL